MHALVIETDDPARELVWTSLPDPSCGPGEVIVDVEACGVNRADLLQREGRYPPPAGVTQVLGLEVAGIISRVSPDVTGWAVGDRVMALLSGGGYSSQVAVPAEMLMRIPESWSMQEAAAFPEGFFTAYTNLFLEGGLEPHESVLIHGGASGVGTAAIQLAHATGCTVFITAGSEEKVRRCTELGAEVGINYREQDFASEVLAKTQQKGVSVVLDMIGAEYFAKNLNVLCKGGRLVVIAVMKGSKAELNLAHLMTKRLRIIGSVLRSRTLEEKVEIKRRFMETFGDRLVPGGMRPVLDRVFSVKQVAQAHKRLQNGENIGKIVLNVQAERQTA